MTKCKETVAIIIGSAGKGTGRSKALSLAREGAKVFVNDSTSEDAANSVPERIKSRDRQL